MHREMPWAYVSKLLGVSKKTLLKYCRQLRIAYIRYPDGSFRFREETLEFFLGHNTVPAARPVKASFYPAQTDRINGTEWHKIRSPIYHNRVQYTAARSSVNC